MKFLRTAIGNFRTLALGDLSADEARRVAEANDLLLNGWPGGDGPPGRQPESVKKRLAATQVLMQELTSGEPERQRKALQSEHLAVLLSEETARNQKLRAMRYFDEIPTEQLNFRTAREFCEFDIASRPDFSAEDEDWRRNKFPDIPDDEVRKEASLVWRWSGIFVSQLLLSYSAADLQDAEVNKRMLKNFQDHLMVLPEQEFVRRLNNIARVATVPVPARVLPYADFMREPATVQALKDLWRTKNDQGMEQKFGWIRRIEEKILISPTSR